MTKFVSIQTAPQIDGLDMHEGELHERSRMPYPYHVDEQGNVLRQEFWRGDPKKVVGFQRDLARQEIDLWWADAWKDPEQAVGMYLVVRDDKGGMGVYLTAVTSMTPGEGDLT